MTITSLRFCTFNVFTYIPNREICIRCNIQQYMKKLMFGFILALTWTLNNAKNLFDVAFHIYPNAFRKNMKKMIWLHLDLTKLLSLNVFGLDYSILKQYNKILQGPFTPSFKMLLQNKFSKFSVFTSNSQCFYTEILLASASVRRLIVEQLSLDIVRASTGCFPGISSS